MMREIDCIICGDKYMGTDRSKFCPACRRERQRKWAIDNKICYAGARARWNKKGVTA